MTKDHFIICYDGIKFQAFSQRRGTLALASEYFMADDLRMNDPLVLPFSFLFPGRLSASFTAVKNSSAWKDFVKESKYLKTESWKGNQVYVVQYNRKTEFGIDKTFIYFLKDYFCYPIATKFELDGKMVTVVEVADYHIQNTNDIQVLIPTDIRFTIGNYLEHVKIKPSSIILNEPIDDDLFTFKQTSADKVLDWDRIFEEEKKRDRIIEQKKVRDQINSENKLSNFTMIRFIMFGIGFLMVVLAIYFKIRKTKR
jgi:hypothetical protein